MDLDRLSLFLLLPLELRQRVYSHLLSPHPQDVTTINYQLSWPYLQNPDSLTFTPYQLDMCGCPKQKKDHIYTRYVCQEPEVQFASKQDPLWILHELWGLFNILRPASQRELERRPSAHLIHVNKQIYRESIPVLYRGRNFRLLSGPCPRGRYQAYATQKWLARLSPLARSHVTDLGLICQIYEEDCVESDAIQSYNSLSHYILRNLLHFEKLHLLRLPRYSAVQPFSELFQKKGVTIVVTSGRPNGEMSEFYESKDFLRNCTEPPAGDISQSRRLLRELRVESEDIESTLEETLSLRE
ncbi:uncharacterized protein BDR25DRAFT_33589 [Lindgomyces ingoldianus]|uniref:Uncharacterized protein n=1 Tax=Lindgomyces ingoldianus TaxID=673940 RepID=A0ACB6QVI9_9PLEO|nr:uncharacterized protein BDR25DRAFT_33589 [Lindgomyces ingoldianus]KAF2470292.1 hypothetical protein BDR25DRAFT_33589 [Lindgomyces ingoldianus]